ncbi:MAG: oligosaccharide flippase family protein [Aureispira sp.]|nr:oligosaccharide flippase family protein [Aureispira sp.]
MNREFLLNLMFLIAINLLVKPFFIFGIDLNVQNMVGAESYGWYFSLFNFSYLFSILGDLGLQQYNNRRIAQHSYLLDKYFPTFLLIKSALAVGLLIVAFTVAWIMQYDWASFYLLLFLLLNQVFIGFILFFRSNISGLQHYRLDSFVSILDKLLMIIFCSFLIWGPWQDNFRIEWFVYAQTLAYGLAALVALFMVMRYMKDRIQFNWRWTTIVAIIKQTLPFALTVFLMTIYLRVDGVMIERLIPGTEGDKEAGIYAAGYRILDAVNIIGLLFANLLLPMFAKMLKDKESIVELALLSFKIIFTITVSFSITTAFWSKSIVELMYTQNTESIAPVLALLVFCFNIMGTSYIFGTLLTANSNMREMNRIFLVGVFLNIVSNIFLIQWYGAWGAAITTLVTQGLIVLGQIVLVHKIFKFSFPKQLLLRMVIFVLSVIAINWLVGQWVSIHWILAYILCGLLSVIVAIATKILELNSILSIFKTKTI